MFVDNDVVYTNTGLLPNGEEQGREQEDCSYRNSHRDGILSPANVVGCCKISISLVDRHVKKSGFLFPVFLLPPPSQLRDDDEPLDNAESVSDEEDAVIPRLSISGLATA